MAAYTRVNLKSDVQDMAPQFGMEGDRGALREEEPRARELGPEQLPPRTRLSHPFGHTHSEQEEVYVVVAGSARVAIGDEVVELGEWDAVRIPAG